MIRERARFPAAAESQVSVRLRRRLAGYRAAHEAGHLRQPRGPDESENAESPRRAHPLFGRRELFGRRKLFELRLAHPNSLVLEDTVHLRVRNGFMH